MAVVIKYRRKLPSGRRGANEWVVTLALNAVAGHDNVNKALRGVLPWTSEPFVQSIDRLNGWWKKGYFGKNYFALSSAEQTADMMAAGRAGMMPTGTSQFQNVATDSKKAGTEAGFVGFPEEISAIPENRREAAVQNIEPTGSETYVEMSVDGQMISVILRDRSPFRALFDLIESDRRSKSFICKHNLFDPRFAPVGLCSKVGSTQYLSLAQGATHLCDEDSGLRLN